MRKWVNCPICGEPDMEKESDGDGYIINCVNLACASNGGDNSSALKTDARAELIAENARLVEDARLLRVQIDVGDKAFQHQFADLQLHKDALKEAKVAFDAFVSWADELNKMVGHKPDVESYRAVEKSLATINKVLAETEGK